MKIINKLIQEYKSSYTYFFQDKEFYKKLWILPLLLLFPIIKFPIGIIFVKGWQVQMVEDVSKGKPLQSLNIKNIFIKGLLITGATLSYLVVPTIICYILGLDGIFGFISDVITFLKNGAMAYIIDAIEDYIATFIIYAIWGLISNPILQCGIIRYAVSGNWIDLFHLPKNILYLTTHIHHFLKFYIFYLVTIFLVSVLDWIIPFPSIEYLLLPFLICLYYGTVSYELGHLGQKLNEKKNTHKQIEDRTDY